jgi:hypothetical protein
VHTLSLLSGETGPRSFIDGWTDPALISIADKAKEYFEDAKATGISKNEEFSKAHTSEDEDEKQVGTVSTGGVGLLALSGGECGSAREERQQMSVSAGVGMG